MFPVSKHSQRQVRQHSNLRPGEGAVLDVVLQQGMSVTGNSLTGLAVNVGQAPVPDRKYVAELYSVEYVDSLVRVAFGQRKYGRQDLRNLLVVHIGSQAIIQFVDSINAITLPTYDEIAHQMKIVPAPMYKIEAEPEQTVAVAANMLLSAVSGYEAVLDLYKYSAFSLMAAQRESKLAIDPVARIDLPTAQFFGLIGEFRKLAEHLPRPESLPYPARTEIGT
jgi:hypothetical protein